MSEQFCTHYLTHLPSGVVVASHYLCPLVAELLNAVLKKNETNLQWVEANSLEDVKFNYSPSRLSSASNV